MKRNILILLIVCITIFACNNKPKKPKNLISKSKMEALLHDLYIVNAAKGVNRKLLENNTFVPDTYIFTRHSIDSTQFADSNAYYAFYIEDYKSIIDHVKARLEKEKAEFDTIIKVKDSVKKQRQDSIKKATKKNKLSKKILLDSINLDEKKLLDTLPQKFN